MNKKNKEINAIKGGVKIADIGHLIETEARKSGYAQCDQKVGLHSLGFVGKTRQEAIADYYPSYKEMFDKIGRERGFGPVTKAGFEAQDTETGALLVGVPKELSQLAASMSD